MINEYNLSVQISKSLEDGIIKFRIYGRLNCNILNEVWGYWKKNINEAFISFEEELKKSWRGK